MQTLYGVLGIRRDADRDQIRVAFRKLAKIYHPDLNRGDREVEQRFTLIYEAYQTLKDDEKRADYDRQLEIEEQRSREEWKRAVLRLASAAAFCAALIGAGIVLLPPALANWPAALTWLEKQNGSWLGPHVAPLSSVPRRSVEPGRTADGPGPILLRLASVGDPPTTPASSLAGEQPASRIPGRGAETASSARPASTASRLESSLQTAPLRGGTAENLDLGDLGPTDGHASGPGFSQYPAEALAGELAGAARCGAPTIEAIPLEAGLVDIAIASSCRAGERVWFAYSGVQFVKQLDTVGKLAFRIDCFAGPGPLKISLSDRTEYIVDLPPRDLDRVTKVAITWTEPVDLDLHAFEYAAAEAGDGHVWSRNPRSLARVKSMSAETGQGHGYLSTSSVDGEPGTHVEVYTFWHQPSQSDGAVRLVVDYVSRGSQPQGEFCSDGHLAGLKFDVYILEHGIALRHIQRAFAPVPCGEPINNTARFSAKLIPDIVLAR